MSAFVNAKCPGCKKTLRIPSDWVNRALRCKNCGITVHAKAELREAPETPSAIASTVTPEPLSPSGGSPEQDVQSFLRVEEDGPIVRVSHRYRRGRGGRWVLLAGVLSSLLAVLGAAYFFKEPLGRLATSLRELVAENPEDAENKPETADTPLPGSAAFPRRALIICVNNYLYANPVSYGDEGHSVYALGERLRRAFHIDQTQFAELSDAAQASPVQAGFQTPAPKSVKGKSQRPPVPPSPARLPLKPVIEKTIGEFLDTSRAQDRILVLFLGHVVEIDGDVYLVPLEGEFKVKESLIPLAWLYERLQRCPARQKVLVVDTCRLDPTRGVERPTSGPMPAKVDALLVKPPQGVQVWSACSAGQFSYEQDGRSVFLEMLFESLNQQAIGKIQRAEDPFPLDAIAKVANKNTSTLVAKQLKAQQTPRLAGKEVEGGAAPNKQEALPPKIDIPQPPPPPGGMARPDEIRSILSEIDLPPIKLARADTAALQIEAMMPFSAKKLAPYQADYASLKEIETNPERFPLRAAVLDAVKLLREKFNPKNPELVLRDYFAGNNSEAIKKEILKEQEKPADILSELNTVSRRLEKVGEKRDEEPSKRWQAHYDYVLAQVLARIAYLEEYSLMLGKIRKDELPPLEAGHTGYRLASRERLQSGTEVRARVTASKKLFAKVARQHKGTPWEILAKREQLTALGLEWQPTK
jgi:hypothetical protein